MMMATVSRHRLRLGPTSHGCSVTLEEFEAADFEPGVKYELIDGTVAVSPLPNLSENVLDNWIFFLVQAYTRRRPDVVNYATYKSRVFVPGGGLPSVPEPDLAAYHDFPLAAAWDRTSRWPDVSPLLVGEVVSPEDPDKDYVRNVELYLRVPSIREYWILDGGDEPSRPTLTVYRRRGSRWQRPIRVGFGDTYSTKLLPEFELLIDPRRPTA
jgi:Uma2 family endonuclease